MSLNDKSPASAGDPSLDQVHFFLRGATTMVIYQVKLRNLVRFLENGDRGKITIRFRGREMAHQEIGMKLMARIEADVEELATVEMRPKMEGRQMTMVIAPRKKK